MNHITISIDQQRQVLSFINEEDEYLTVKEIAECIDGMQLHIVDACLQYLKKDGLITATLSRGREAYKGKHLDIHKIYPIKTTSKQASTKTTTKRNKPFTPNPTVGYRVEKGKVLVFLDRKASSKTLTLTVQDLKELITAVEKSQMAF